MRHAENLPAASSAAIRPAKRPGALNTAARIREELARVYKDARQGRIEPGTGTKLANILMCLFHVLQGGELEERVEVLERRMEGQP